MGKNFYDQAIDSNMTRNEKTRKLKKKKKNSSKERLDNRMFLGL